MRADPPPLQGRGRNTWRRKFAGKPRDHSADRTRAGAAHDRKAVTADLDLDRRHGRAVFRAGGHAALAGGVGFFGHHCDPRRCRRIVVGKTDPALLAERMRPMMQRDQPAADKKFMLAFGFVALIWFLAIGLDKRYHASDVPLALQVLGWAMLLLSTGFIMWVMRENSFAAPVVKLQTERGHRVISTGPYAWVRHPMYSGTILFFVGAPLLLGSWWGVAMSPLFVVLFAVRVRIEERALLAGLAGYGDYAAQVRYRLVPGLW